MLKRGEYNRRVKAATPLMEVAVHCVEPEQRGDPGLRRATPPGQLL
jgi:hypothetical protein